MALNRLILLGIETFIQFYGLHCLFRPVIRGFGLSNPLLRGLHCLILLIDSRHRPRN
jgi:hypothetical protein